MTLKPFALCLMVPACLGGCASFDSQDVQLLGSSTASNIALQSIRDVDTPNYEAIEGGEGGSSAQAIAALRNQKAGQ